MQRFFCVILTTLFLQSPYIFGDEPKLSEQKPEIQKSGTEKTARDQFKLLPGFQIELLYTVPKEEQGSWVVMTFDPKGRIIASDQGGKGLFRITPPKIGSDESTVVEKLDVDITSAQGLLFAFDSLYVSVNGRRPNGLYRVPYDAQNDSFGEVERIMSIKGGGEHGPHALRLSPDGKSIYWICGNHTDPPEKIHHTRMLPNWGEDLLLPRQWDARGHARGKLAPGGWIAKSGPEGKEWEIVSNGYRNAYDFDFNADGELFAYDADMEWDLGMPWYRPTRFCHATSGSEFGWRSGSGKWPTYFADSLPAVVDIGPGSPVGVTFGYGTKFPAKYQRAAYLLDWTFGTMFAIHLVPSGASYVGKKEEFVSRIALPLTDADVGPDGALYFTVGGRGTQSALYRVTYVGDQPTDTVDGSDSKGKDLRAIRRQLESFHQKGATPDHELIWKNLGHSDRHIRFAARTALEKMDVNEWRIRALNESDSVSRIYAMIALARATSRQADDDVTRMHALVDIATALAKVDVTSLKKGSQLDLLRAYSLAFIRLGKPNNQLTKTILTQIEGLYPSNDMQLDRELSRVLVYLNAPTVVQKTLTLMDQKYDNNLESASDLLKRNPGYGNTIANMIANQPELQKLHYAFVLRNMRFGWTLDERKEYFGWLHEAQKRSGGASYVGFLKNIEKEAKENLSDAERKALESNEIFKPIPEAELPKAIGPGKEWTIDKVVALADGKLNGRNFESGKRTFAAAKCSTCHRFDGHGGATGPDLTSVAARFSVRDLCESLIQPSKVISDQYRASVVITSEGLNITGRIVGDADGKLTIQTNPEDASVTKTVDRSSVESITPSQISLMPEKLLDSLNQDEVLDLLAYMLSRGNADDIMFAKK